MPRLSALLPLALAAFVATPALASPNGVWELDSKDTRFKFELCGDGNQLCGQLVWLSDVDYNEQYKPYLNKPMANRLRPSGSNAWKGNLKLFGFNMSGTITQHSEDHMTLQGCAVLVVCKSYEMYRVSQ
ncbi:DUF2147 domain-containing protein [Devosia sp. BK]|uniref:DUF2147 domain-containing protein n=1 Tax=unclassified Devosia TaxID=196773 RepID=UPI0007866E3B|nr:MULTISPECIES: DUF2147 domain-containing protein [unclassified Devosia]MDV3250201.1 DUF2147 domain-containing protein [Devosia sp. BK]